MYPEFIFVYGTLRKVFTTNTHYLLAKHCEYFSDGSMQGKLYEVDGYPGAIETCNREDKVFGELYKIIDNSSILTQLDYYEECTEEFPAPHEYSRKMLPINLLGAGKVKAWVYVYNHDVSNLSQIESGDYTSQFYSVTIV